MAPAANGKQKAMKNSKTDDDDFVPPPDLHALIREYGGYSKIPPTAWAKYDRDMEQWKNELRAKQKSNGVW